MFFVLFFMFIPYNDFIFKQAGAYFSIIVHAACIVYYGTRRIERKYSKTSTYLLFSILMQIELVLSATLQGGVFWPFAKIGMYIVSGILMFQYELKRDARSFLITVITVFDVFVVIHSIERVLERPYRVLDFTGPVYYLGSDNDAVSYFILLFILCAVYLLNWKPNLFSIMGLLISPIMVFYSKSGTGMIAFVVFFVLFSLSLIPIAGKLVKLLSNTVTVIIAYSVMLFIMISASLVQFTSIGQFVQQVTGKDITNFSARTQIWGSAINVFLKKPIFGIGYGAGANGNGVYARGFYFGAHNLFLQWLVNGGIVCGVLFVICFVASLRRLDSIKIEKRYFLLSLVAIYLVAMSMENYFNGIHIFPILTVVCYIPVFCTNKELPRPFFKGKRKRIKLVRGHH